MEPRAQDDGICLLSLGQIQTVHSCNEYTESPSTCPRPRIPDSAPDVDPVPSPDDHNQDSSSLHSPRSARRFTDNGPTSEPGIVGHVGETVAKEQPETSDPEVQKGLFVTSAQDPGFPENLGNELTAEKEEPESFEWKRETLESGESFTSEHRSRESAHKPDVAIREQPKSCNPEREETKLLGRTSTAQTDSELKQETNEQPNTKHPSPCDRCRRCKCADCAVATPLPACWLCGRRCLCSAEALVEYTTCVCCLKALLYHCSSDDEDSSADAPFSCHKSRRCTRWGTAVAMAFFLPCLLCYGPARGCLTLCQLCHERTHRTGCRCKSQHVTSGL